MMVKSFFTTLLCFIIVSSDTTAQYISLHTVCKLPDTLFESSGITYSSAGRIFSHNDSGDLPRIFEIDTSGNTIRIIYLSSATAYDYEDITRDVSGNIYIGDFGNNFNNRTNLCIYKIPFSEISKDTVMPEVITFTYSDQQEFPPLPAGQNFDCESFFFYNDSLYLFSKNWSNSDYTKMYLLPAAPGNYIAMLTDSFQTNGWITSASLNPSATVFALLSESQIWLHNGFRNGRFTPSAITTLMIDSSQKEGITFINDTAVFISDEGIPGEAGNLYYLSLGKWIPQITKITTLNVSVQYTPSPNTVTWELTGSDSYKVELFDVQGKLVDEVSFSTARVRYDYTRKHAGILLMRVTARDGIREVRKIMIY